MLSIETLLCHSTRLFGVNQGTRGPIVSTLAATLYAGGGVGRIYSTIALGFGLGTSISS